MSLFMKTVPLRSLKHKLASSGETIGFENRYQ